MKFGSSKNANQWELFADEILRFGIDDEKKSDLISEMGDVQCMLDLLGDHLNISSDEILEASSAKREKLKKWSNLIK